jgi:hypothetical protein
MCELCAAPLDDEHEHLLEPATARLACACAPCLILFSGQTGARYRRVPKRIELLSDFQLGDEHWEALHLPINLAFFFFSSRAERVVAIYPSPAGGTESLLALDSWQQLEAFNPVLRELEPDVEALLVNRVRTEREYYRAPIDVCYRLVGVIRANWRGLSGGALAWQEIGSFFADLKRRSARHEARCHA